MNRSMIFAVAMAAASTAPATTATSAEAVETAIKLARQYQVEKDVPQHRMLAAILLQPEKAWFFKVTGDNQQVGDLEVEDLSAA